MSAPAHSVPPIDAPDFAGHSRRHPPGPHGLDDPLLEHIDDFRLSPSIVESWPVQPYEALAGDSTVGDSTVGGSTVADGSGNGIHPGSPSAATTSAATASAITTPVGTGASVARAAAMIAGVTVLSRLFGFLRTLVFSHTVGHGDLADAYNSANQIPNTIFDIVAGGALASVAVPLLAGALGRGERAYASRTVSALLTWTLAVLLPLCLLGIGLAFPLGSLIAGPHGPASGYPEQVGRFLVLFLPQIPLYGVAVVLSAALQADRRFFAPATAPLLSSLVMVTTYSAFGALDPSAADDLGRLTGTGWLVLGTGTTLGVCTLALSLMPSVRRAGFRIRPTFRFAPGVARQARRLAGAGTVTLVAQNCAVLGVVFLTNYADPSGGALTVYNFSWAVYLLPYAVLVVPIATSAFTELAALAEGPDTDRYRAGIAGTARAVTLAGCAGAGLLAAVAWPMASLFIAHHSAGPGAAAMAYGLLAFAPGLPGFAAIALLGRVLYASGYGRDAATATSLGWLVVFAADAVLIFTWRAHPVTALGLGNSLGMVLAGALLLRAVRRRVGAVAFAGLGRTALAGLLGAVAAGGLGWVVGLGFGWTGVRVALLVGPLCTVVALGLYILVVLPLDAAQLVPLLTRLRSRAVRRR